MGVGALAAGTLTSICHRYPEAEISFLDYGKQSFTIEFSLADRNVPIRFINIRFSKKFYLPNNIALLILLSLLLRLLPTKGLRHKCAALNPWLRHIYDLDLVVSMAGGDSFSDIYGFGRFLYVALPQLLALFLGKRLILLPQTLGPFKAKPTRWIAKYILSHADTVYSRDRIALSNGNLPIGNGRHARDVRFCYDVGFVVNPRPPATSEPVLRSLSRGASSSLVGLNVSGLLAMGGYNQQNMFGLKGDYKQLMARLISFFIDSRDANVLLIPHVFGAEENPESDSAACQALYRSLRPLLGDKLHVVEGAYDQNEIKHIIGMCDFFIGSRMHACIAALSQSIPALAIAYSDKFMGVLQTLDIDALVADARKMDEDSIVSAAARTYDQRSSIRQCLNRKIPLVKETVLSLFADVERCSANP
jgi:polysaccharide pyruvyl transferase WcaK-like protein